MKRYHVTTRLGDRTITFQEPLDDPFVRHDVTIGWRDLLRGLVRRELLVTVIIDGDPETVRALMNLNTETSTPSACRRSACLAPGCGDGCGYR